jgi:hypothetical protein
MILQAWLWDGILFESGLMRRHVNVDLSRTVLSSSVSLSGEYRRHATRPSAPPKRRNFTCQLFYVFRFAFRHLEHGAQLAHKTTGS